jgi:hypothetical protein
LVKKLESATSVLLFLQPPNTCMQNSIWGLEILHIQESIHHLIQTIDPGCHFLSMLHKVHNILPFNILAFSTIPKSFTKSTEYRFRDCAY